MSRRLARHSRGATSSSCSPPAGMAPAHQRSLPMGIVPLGTANIVARELGLPAGWRRATRRVLEHFPATRAVDLARVNDGYMALAAGIGFDATVMRHTPA